MLIFLLVLFAAFIIADTEGYNGCIGTDLKIHRAGETFDEIYKPEIRECSGKLCGENGQITFWIEKNCKTKTSNKRVLNDYLVILISAGCIFVFMLVCLVFILYHRKCRTPINNETDHDKAALVIGNPYIVHGA
uniref:Cnidarian restricted protein n=1 Tax=Clytia hemisphaerica TaxID=252671 RepID=A0A7M5WTA6_9CNID